MKLENCEIITWEYDSRFCIRFEAPDEVREKLLDAMKNRRKIRMDLSIENGSPPSI